MAITSLRDIQKAGESAFSATAQALVASPMARVTVDIIPAVRGNAWITAADSNVRDNSTIVCQLVANSDFDVDDLDDMVISGAPGAQTGTIDFVVSSSGPIVGTLDIAYFVGTP